VGAKKFYKAIDFYQDIVEQDFQGNHDPWCKWQLGYQLIKNEVNIEEGLQLIDESFKSNSGFEYFLSYLHHAKGLGLHIQGKDKEALEHLLRGWELRPYYDHDHFLHIKEVEKVLSSGIDN
jgi:tetratricopeptide (TPR) repeat protein